MNDMAIPTHKYMTRMLSIFGKVNHPDTTLADMQNIMTEHDISHEDMLETQTFLQHMQVALCIHKHGLSDVEFVCTYLNDLLDIPIDNELRKIVISSVLNMVKHDWMHPSGELTSGAVISIVHFEIALNKLHAPSIVH